MGLSPGQGMTLKGCTLMSFLNRGNTESLTNQILYVRNSVGGVHSDLILGGITDQTLHASRNSNFMWEIWLEVRSWN